MAILKDVPTDFGVSAKYWNVSVLQEHFAEKRLVVVLVGYVDEAAYRAGKKPMSETSVTLDGTDYVREAKLDTVYTAILKLDAWKGAEKG